MYNWKYVRFEILLLKKVPDPWCYWTFIIIRLPNLNAKFNHCLLPVVKMYTYNMIICVQNKHLFFRINNICLVKCHKNSRVWICGPFLLSIVITFYSPTKLAWPGDSEGTFRSSSQAATCPSVYHTRWRLHTVPLIAERQAGKLWIPIFIVFGLTRPEIKPVSTASVADALSTRPLIGSFKVSSRKIHCILIIF